MHVGPGVPPHPQQAPPRRLEPQTRKLRLERSEGVTVVRNRHPSGCVGSHMLGTSGTSRSSFTNIDGRAFVCTTESLGVHD
jgi:hypothetical protein